MTCSISRSWSPAKPGCARQPAEPKELVESAGATLRSLVESRGSPCHSVAIDLPTVFVDARQIGHVFSNLISNAAVHSKPGDEILIAANFQNGSVRFSVTDHGPGVPEYQSQIFDRFFRVPGLDPRGAGLGLAIAGDRSGRRAMGVQSIPNQGSEFYFELPSVNVKQRYEPNVLVIVYDEPNVRLQLPSHARNRGLCRCRSACGAKALGAKSTATASTSRSSICACRKWMDSTCSPRCAIAAIPRRR